MLPELATYFFIEGCWVFLQTIGCSSVYSIRIVELKFDYEPVIYGIRVV